MRACDRYPSHIECSCPFPCFFPPLSSPSSTHRPFVVSMDCPFLSPLHTLLYSVPLPPLPLALLPCLTAYMGLQPVMPTNNLFVWIPRYMHCDTPPFPLPIPLPPLHSPHFFPHPFSFLLINQPLFSTLPCPALTFAVPLPRPVTPCPFPLSNFAELWLDSNCRQQRSRLSCSRLSCESL